MIKKQKNAYALIMSVLIIFVCTLLAIFLLEYIIPFMNNTKGMENGVKAYYNAYKGIEEGLFILNNNKKNLYHVNVNKTYEKGISSNKYTYTITSTGNIMPQGGMGNSVENRNYNIISMNEPVQIILPSNSKISNLKLNIKLPSFVNNTIKCPSNANSNSLENIFISWQISSKSNNKTYIAYTGTGRDIITSNTIRCTDVGTKDRHETISLNAQVGYDSSDGTKSKFNKNFSTILSNYCTTDSYCTLTLTVVNRFYLKNDIEIPYFEYQITGGTLANYYTIIKSDGISYSYKRDLEIYVPQQTTISAFNFAVMQ